MMHGPEKSELAVVAVKPANKVEQPAPERSAAKLKAAEPVERRAGTRGMRVSKARTGHRAGQACHRRWNAYGKQLPSPTRGGSRMRESRTYGSMRGARDETRVPTATTARVHHKLAPRQLIELHPIHMLMPLPRNMLGTSSTYSW